jgi:tagatose kinase
MPNVITIGEVLVEIMAKKIDQDFSETAEFQGPFPSGAPAIFIDQVAKTGSSCGIIGSIGNDGFGKINYDRLKRDGVNLENLNILDSEATGVAFVTYKNNGDRNFIFHLKNSAAGCVNEKDIKEEYFKDCNYFHIMGCSLFNDNIIDSVKKAILICKKNNIKISFDPNVRKEILKDNKIYNFIKYILVNCDIFLPGEEELKIISGIEDEKEAVKTILDYGVKYILVKRGNRGCTLYNKEYSIDSASINVKEIDPTGAGDCFGGTLISCLNQGMDVRKAVIFANAAGAMAVTKKGPMEGNSTINEIENFINEKR